MLDTYRAVFRAPGTAAFTISGFVMGMPQAMYPIALVLIISARDGRYGFAGVTSACFIAGGVAGLPLLSRLVDRLGQHRLLIPATSVHVAAVLATCALVELDVPDWAVLPPVFVFGFTYLSVGSLVRARWSWVLAGRPELTTAYSLASILDEAIFVSGPLIATVIATTATPVLILVLAAVLAGSGALTLSFQRGTEPPVHPGGDTPHRSALREPGVALVTLVTVFTGAVFATAEVTMIAFCGQHGHRGLSGLVVALFAGGSGFAGFLYGARQHGGDALSRFRLQAIVFGVLPVLFLIPTDVAVLAVVAFVVGLGTAPALITTFSLVERLVPPAALTEGLTWVQVGLSVGYGAGAAVVGGIADAHGARTAFVATIAAGLGVLLTAVLGSRRLRALDLSSHTPVGPSEHAALP